MHDSIPFYVIAVLFVATLVRSSLGFGEALVAVPLLALRLPIATAAALAVLVSTAMAAIVVTQDWQHVRLRSAGQLLIGALPGVPIGVALLAKGNERVVKFALGVLILGFSLYTLRGVSKFYLPKDHKGWLLGCGFLSGVLGGAYGMNGPPLAVYRALRRWSPEQFRAPLQGYFLVASGAGLLGYLTIGVWNRTVTELFLWSLPGVMLATLLGRTLNRRIRGSAFFRSVCLALAAAGTLLVVQAFL